MIHIGRKMIVQLNGTTLFLALSLPWISFGDLSSQTDISYKNDLENKVCEIENSLEKDDAASINIVNEKVEIQKSFYTYVTAYNSLPEQTDSTPCITANGFDLCKHNMENVVAANFLPFGTTMRIPEHFGDRIFTVQDRMHPRYKNYIDIWMEKKSDAKNFGVRRLKIEVVKIQSIETNEIAKNGTTISQEQNDN